MNNERNMACITRINFSRIDEFKIFLSENGIGISPEQLYNVATEIYGHKYDVIGINGDIDAIELFNIVGIDINRMFISWSIKRMV